MNRRSLHIALLFFLLFGFRSFATHNRAGEITYKRIAPFSAIVGGVTVPVFTYSITVILYTADGQLVADRCIDTLYFGDNQREVITRVNGPTNGCDCRFFSNKPVGCGVLIINEPDYKVKQNIYTTIHTYPGAGTYTIHTTDPNRNKDVKNMTNSINQAFYVESLLIIDNFTGANTSPQFSFPPIDKACLNVCYQHNPGAFDIDGDSLSYELTSSRTTGGQSVPGYFYPETGAGGTYAIHPVTGLLTWCTPQFQAEYNVAFIVKEWRKNTSGSYNLVGYVLRDMQVIVNVCPNNIPPLIAPQSPVCIEAGKSLSRELEISDVNSGQTVTLSGGGGAFAGTSPLATLNPSSGLVLQNQGNRYFSTFSWQTSCDHLRSLPYYCTVKATDNGILGENKLVSFQTFEIRVVPPAVTGLTAVPQGNALRISWNPAACNPASNKLISYTVYRKNDCSQVSFDPCGKGPDPGLTFDKIAVLSASVTSLTDNDNNKGLVVGQSYGYLVIAEYEDGIRSLSGTQICAELRKDLPFLSHVDVLSTAASSGSIQVRWLAPSTKKGNLDTLAYKGPYQYRLYHKSSTETNYTEVFSRQAARLNDLPLNFIHGGINTESSAHHYEIRFLSDTILLGASRKASALFATAVPGDRRIDLSWESSAPWKNYQFEIFRKDPDSSAYRLLTKVAASPYADTRSVVNGSTYCYYVRAYGQYSDTTIVRPLINHSQIVCAKAVDKIPPVRPLADISANCQSGFLEVSWADIRNESDDAASYEVFYKPALSAEYMALAKFKVDQPRQFNSDNPSNFAGCYAVRATDVNGNVGALSADLCVDICPEFELPNVFSPNEDLANDEFKAVRVKQIKDIDLSVVDRWGHLVYHTTDPYFKWDGISQSSKQACSEGTYFYVCTVSEPRLRGAVRRTIKGHVQLVR